MGGEFVGLRCGDNEGESDVVEVEMKGGMGDGEWCGVIGDEVKDGGGEVVVGNGEGVFGGDLGVGIGGGEGVKGGWIVIIV